MTSPFLDVRVARRLEETPDITTFELVSPDGGRLPAFCAGAHIDVAVPGGWVRPYSLCNHPQERHRYLIGVLKEAAGRGASRAMHERVREGDLLRIGAPRNHFALAHGASCSLLLAGGIGVTPILCMAEQLAATGAAFEMHYCARSRDRAAFVDRIGQSPFAARVRHHFDDGAPGQRLDLATLFAEDDRGTHAYVCGPQGFVDAVLGAARRAGWAEERLHCELFSTEARPAAGESAFEVTLASTGQVIAVPADRTVAQALADAGVLVPTSCEQGLCGTCLTRVLEGVVDHRDLFLTPEEQAANDRFTPCCSRAKTRVLVLDL